MLNSYKPSEPHSSIAPHQVRTSSIAITTSTVSKLSSPRSFEKCEVDVSYIHQSLSHAFLKINHTFDGSVTFPTISQRPLKPISQHAPYQNSSTDQLSFPQPPASPIQQQQSSTSQPGRPSMGRLGIARGGQDVQLRRLDGRLAAMPAARF